MKTSRSNTTLNRIIMRHLDSTLSLIEAALWLTLLSKLAREAYTLIRLIQ